VIRITAGGDELRKKQWPVAGDQRLGSICGMGDEVILERFYLLITPPPFPRSIGIINLGENSKLIYGLQSLSGKILSRKELQFQSSSLVAGPVWMTGIRWVKVI
jgi:hypothetical protein